MAHHWVGIDDVLRFAHKWEAASLIKSPSVQRSSRSSDPDSMCPLDNVAQAALILSLAKRTLSASELSTIRLYYLIPADPQLQKQKTVLILHTADRLHVKTGRPRWWLADVLREWSGGYPEHDAKWWSENLKVTKMTLWRWAKNRNGDSIYAIANAELARAKDKLHSAAITAGLLGAE